MTDEEIIRFVARAQRDAIERALQSRRDGSAARQGVAYANHTDPRKMPAESLRDA